MPDTRPLLSRIAVNPGMPWFVAVPCNFIGGVGLVLLLLNSVDNLSLALWLLIPTAIVFYGTALVLWLRRRTDR
jgi:hypothetical protein